MAELVFGRVPHPPFVDRLVPVGATYAWNDLGQRNPLGCCRHSMVGYLGTTDSWFRYNPKTGRWPTGLTDYGVGGSKDGDLDGVIYRWNDPRSRRAGWANGGSDGLEGDGVAFVRTLGIDAINRDLVSIERSDGGDITTPLSPKQFESICQLEAYWADQAEIPYTSFPVNPAVGIVTDLEHFKFATKACPFDPVRSRTKEFQDRIRQILQQYQVVEVTQPIPIPEAPELVWPNGWNAADLKEQFGKLVETTVNRKTNAVKTALRGFNEKGMISNFWVQRAAEEGITDIERIPRPISYTITKAGDGTDSATLLIPRSGHPDWVAFRGDGNAGWRWLQ